MSEYKIRITCKYQYHPCSAWFDKYGNKYEQVSERAVVTIADTSEKAGVTQYKSVFYESGTTGTPYTGTKIVKIIGGESIEIDGVEVIAKNSDFKICSLKDGYYVARSSIFNDEKTIVEVFGGEVLVCGSSETYSISKFDFGPNPKPLNLLACGFLAREEE